MSGSYFSPAFAKHPWVLSLDRNGTYLWEQLDTQLPKERGRWWRIEGLVVVLTPDDTKQSPVFARVAKQGLDQVVFSDNLAELVDATRHPLNRGRHRDHLKQKQ